MKTIFSLIIMSLMFVSDIFADDIIFKLTNGKFNNLSDGVKILNDIEARQIIGGYDFYYMPELNGNFGSQSFFVTDNYGNIITPTNDSILFATTRVVNSKREFYLETYKSDKSHYSYRGSNSYLILN